MILEILFIIMGYLIGAISPSYFFGKWLKGVDIRKIGTKNLGASNTYLNVSKIAGVITGLFDVGKGFLALFIANFFVSNMFAYTAGLAAVIGHIFPFYLHFKGGKGAATCAGLVVYLMMVLALTSVPWYLLVFIAVLWLIILITKFAIEPTIIVTPSWLFIILYFARLQLEAVFATIILVYLTIISILNIRRYYMTDKASEKRH